jgi:CrcB protein
MLLWIAVGGAAGTVLRYLLGAPVTALTGGRFPLGTLVINVLGSFAIGLFSRTFLNSQTTPVLRASLMVGLCGGFTTFSTFSLETIGLIEGGLYTRAATYVFLSVTLSLLATIAGFAAGKLIAFP